jgi:aminoglycoside phosphotransferase (APT) family kinase protein
MSTITSSSGSVVEKVLRECVETGMLRVSKNDSPVVSVQSRQSEFSSSYNCDIVTVQFADGTQTKVFLKDLSFSRIPKDQARERRERELRIYRDLVGGIDGQAHLGTAKYYGSIWDDEARRYWLMLEYVEGTEVRYCDFAYWIGAIRWLGMMQRYFAQHSDLNDCDYLVRHSPDFFISTLELAIHTVSQLPPSLAHRLTEVLHAYNGLVRVMAKQPKTVVHGSYRPQNVLVNAGAEQLRFCPIDWELAAFGSPLYDVAVFADGFEGPMLHQLLDTYRVSAQEYGIAVLSADETAYVVDCFRLHKIVKSLGKPRDWKLQEETIARYVDRAENLAASCAEAKTTVRRKPFRIVQGDLNEHAAVRAWQSVQSQQPVPASVQILKEKEKSQVYRLTRAGPEGGAVIAKRCRTETAWVERTVYEEILPTLPVTHPRHYGFTEQDDGFCWIFLEDAGTVTYLPRFEEHRIRATQWLGLMHVSAANLAAPAHLPDRGPNHYLNHLRSARQRIVRNIRDPRIDAASLTVLENIATLLDTLESRWSEMETRCGSVPSTLVHGDFRPKNVRVRTTDATLSIFPLDWETAGWGVPAKDISDVPIEVYWSVVREWWPDLSVQALRSLAKIGKLFRWLAALDWETASFTVKPTEKAIRNMTVCRAWLASAMKLAFSKELPS